jgi:hypothetical protein
MRHQANTYRQTYRLLPLLFPGRTSKQLREKWANQLNPNINKNPWTREEDRILLTQKLKHGNQWSKISKYFIGRYVFLLFFGLASSWFKTSIHSSWKMVYIYHSFTARYIWFTSSQLWLMLYSGNMELKPQQIIYRPSYIYRIQ